MCVVYIAIIYCMNVFLYTAILFYYVKQIYFSLPYIHTPVKKLN